MSIRIYFSPEIIDGLEYYEVAGSDRFFFGRCQLKKTDGGLYFSSDLDDKPILPEGIWQYVHAYSLHVQWRSVVGRESGVYSYLTAEARVESTLDGGGRMYYSVKAAGKSADDCHKLVEMIREGSIRPVRSFEQPQITREEFEKQAPKFVPILPPAGDPGFLRPKVAF